MDQKKFNWKWLDKVRDLPLLAFRLLFMAKYFIIFFILLNSVLPVIRAEVGKDENRLFKSGQKMMEDNLYELAEKQFQELLKEFPQSDFREETVWLLAKARLKQGRWAEATDLLEMQLASVSEAWQDDYLFLMGEAQLKGEIFDAAFKTYQNLAGRFPKSKYVMEAKYGMAQALLQQQKFEAAEEILHILQKEGRGELASKASLSLGISLVLQKKYDKASELLTPLSERKNAVGFQALYALGEMAFERKQNDLAHRHFETITKSDRTEAYGIAPPALFRLGRIEAIANNWVAAADNYEQAFRKSDDASFRLKCVDELLEVYLQLTKVDALADKLKSWAGENSKTRLGEALLLQVGMLWQRAGKQEQAAEAFQIFFEKYPEGSFKDRAHYQFGGVLFEDKKYEAAAVEFQKAAEAAEKNKNSQLQADAWLKLGDLNFGREQFDAAISAYIKCTQVKGADISKTEPAFYQAANANFKAGHFPEILKLYTGHQTQYPNGKLIPEFLLLVAETHRRMNEPQKVAEDYKKILDKYPSSSYVPVAWVEYSRSLYTLNKFKEAVQEVDAFVEKYEKHELVPKAMMIRALSFERLEQTEQAVKEFESLANKYPKTPVAVEAQFWLGTYFDRKKNYAEAQKQFELLQKNNKTHPKAAEATYFAARAAYHLGQNKNDAVKLIEILFNEYPNSPWVFDGYLLHGTILIESQKFTDALLVFDELIKKYGETKDPYLEEKILEVHGQRGECLRQLEKNEEAVAAFKTIVNSPKADAASRNQAYVELAKTYENMGDLTLAQKNYLQPLYEWNPKSASPQEREFFWVCKGVFESVRLLEARKDWKGAAGVLKRAIKENFPCRKEAEERLKKLQTAHADAN